VDELKLLSRSKPPPQGHGWPKPFDPPRNWLMRPFAAGFLSQPQAFHFRSVAL
jgi:hypothetical protein